MNGNKKFTIVSFSSSEKHNAPDVISKAAETKDEIKVLEALTPWGEDRTEVAKAIANGQFSVQESHVVVRLLQHEDTPSSQEATEHTEDSD